jgi:tetratricopeptide (TPR) repeat protein
MHRVSFFLCFVLVGLAVLGQTAAEFYIAGREASANRDDTLAIELYTASLQLDSSQAEVLNARGMAFQKLEMFDLAIIDFTRSIELNPTLDGVYTNRGSAFFLAGDFYAAIADYTTAIDINPLSPGAFYNRAYAKIKIGEIQSACEDLDKVTEIIYIERAEILKERYCK